MLQLGMQDLLECEDIERIRQVVKKSSGITSNYAYTITAIRQQLEEHDKSKKTRKPTPLPVENDKADEDEEFMENDEAEPKEGSTQPVDLGTDSRFGAQYDFNPILDSVTSGESWEKMREHSKCSSCETGPDGLWITECGHLYCQDCSLDLQVAAAQQHGDTQRAPCEVCGTQFNWIRPCQDDEQPKGPTTRSQKRNRKHSPKEDDDIKEDWFNLYGRSMLPSAKTMAVKAQVLQWLSGHPNGKIIVYTQFLAM